MTSIVLLTQDSSWYQEFRQRHLAAYQARGMSPAAADRQADELLDRSQDWTAAAITDDDGRRVGQVVVGIVDPGGRSIGRIVDLWTEPSAAAHRPAALAWAQGWCEQHAARRVAVRLAEPDAVFEGYPLRSQVRFKAIDTAARPDARVTARPMTETEYPVWVDQEHEWYAEEIVRAGGKPLEDARTEAEEAYQSLLPKGLATADTSILVLEAEGAQVGVVWLRHGHLPGVSYLYSIAVHPPYQGRGFGRAAMAVSELTSLAAGDRALMFNVFGGNDVAMNLYTSTGYAVMEESRALDLRP
jgi:ribosomal protein S18 acetylase RimI-like enzyme